MENNDLKKTSEEMQEIKEFLLNSYNGATTETKRRIKILLKEWVVDRVKCVRCGEKFTPEEGQKSAIKIFNFEP